MASPQLHVPSNGDSFNNFHSKLYAAYIKSFHTPANDASTLPAKKYFHVHYRIQ